ncbi:hypothetical protein [Microvirga flavescens]|uniref:hypothetical protein n=1 Tax=Microvirga flavescens TaxID=2249811 RepID=UPI000DD51125|nr:hypothetical protein [Microvirga flavescens]
MRNLAAALALFALTTGAFAQSRPMTTSMTCSQAMLTVTTHGAIVLGTGQYTYDRFVRDSNFCEVGEYPDPAYAPTRDVRQCFIGYRCRTGPNDLW